MKGLPEEQLPTVSPCSADVANKEGGSAAITTTASADSYAGALLPSSCEQDVFGGSRGGQLSAEQWEWVREKRPLLEPYDGMVVMSVPGEHSRKPAIRGKCWL